MLTKDFSYELPPELIAQTPIERRDGSRLMVVDRKTGGLLHRHFSNLPELLRRGDCLVLNNSRVIPARLLGKREGGGNSELLLLSRLDGDRWNCLAKPGRRLREGAVIHFGSRLTGTIEQCGENGERTVRFQYDGVWEEILDEVGALPLPPYIHQKPDDPERYQTVYAKPPGSAAAPTAGLHFTPELLSSLQRMGVKVAEVTLHVGLGTFRPVTADDVSAHKMHTERYEVPTAAADTINQTRAEGGRIIAVGTTSCRTLESSVSPDGMIQAGSGETDIFITPGYTFRAIDALITNFHLPQSTLLMLISAFYTREGVLTAYEEAIRERYRFFSFGDAMLIM